MPPAGMALPFAAKLILQPHLGRQHVALYRGSIIQRPDEVVVLVEFDEFQNTGQFISRKSDFRLALFVKSVAFRIQGAVS